MQRAVVLLANVTFVLTASRANCQESVPQMSEIIDTISTAVDHVHSIHVVWECRSDVVNNFDEVESRLFSYAGPDTDEYAMKADKRFRQWKRVGNNETPVTVHQQMLAYDGHSTQAIGWRTTPPNPPILDNGTISIGKIDDRLEERKLFMCSIGSFFYDGVGQECWRRLCYREGRQVEPSRPFSIVNAIKQPQYRVDGVERIGNQQCVRIMSDGDVLWLSLAHGFAVVRRDWMWAPGEPPMVRYTNSDFREEISGMFWLPRRCEERWFARPIYSADTENAVQIVNDCRVQMLRINDVPDEQFTFEFPVGTLVVDNTRIKDARGEPLSITYGIKKERESTLREMDEAIEISRANSARRRRRRLLTYFNVGAVLFILAIVVVRRLQRSQID